MKLLSVHVLLMADHGTLAEFVEHGSIQENPGKYPDELTMISNLFADHEQIIRSLRTDADRCEEYHDMGTNDFLIGVMEKHERWHGCYVLTWAETGYNSIILYTNLSSNFFII